MTCCSQYELVGDPVNAVTGASVDTRLEFQMPGPIPLQWVRHYDSSKCGQYHALGWGRTHGYDHRLQFDVDGMRYTAPLGRVIGFPPLMNDGGRIASGGYVLERLDWRTYRIHKNSEPSMEFDCPEMAVAPLARLIRGKSAIEFHYAGGRLAKIIDSNGRHIAVTVDDAGRVLALVLEDPQGGRPLLDYYYDPAGNVIESVDPYRNSLKMQYDEQNREVVRTDRLGYSFYFEYDQQGRCVRTTGEDGLHDTRLEYHAREGFTWVTRADGGQWTYLYPEGRLTRIIDPYGGAREFKFDESGRLAEETDPKGNVTRLIYDSAGALLGRRSAIEKDPFETHLPRSPIEWELGNAEWADAGDMLQLPERFRKLVTSAPAPTEPAKLFDDFGKLVRETSADGTIRRWVYDANGSVHRFTDRDGGQYNFDHASWNLRTRVANPKGEAVGLTYTPAEQLATFTDGGGALSEYDYDLKDRLVRVRRHGVVREEYRYDEADNLVEKLDGTGQPLLKVTIGPGNLKLARQFENGPGYKYEYDDRGRLLGAASDEDEIQFEYDAGGRRVKDLRNGMGITHRFSNGRLIQTTFFDRFQVHYKIQSETLFILDPRGEEHRVRSAGSGAFLRTTANGSSELAQYNADGRCVLKAASLRRWSDLWLRRYTYSGEGDLLAAVDNVRGAARYTYDPAHRLADGFEYDPAGNLLRQPGLNQVRIRDGNRIAEANGERFEYNSRNHISARISEAGTTRYIYDSSDMLVAVEGPKGRWEARYDALARRVSTTAGGHTKSYYWDGDRLAAEVSSDGRVRLYIYADDFSFTPFLLLDYADLEADPKSGKACYLYCNHLATPLVAEDDAGSVVWQARVEPYGAASIGRDAAVDVPLRFPGHYFDAETGLHYNRYRYYSPELGRYLQSDPVGIRGGANLYAYTNNPLKRVDLEGLNDCGDDDPPPPPPPKPPDEESNDFADEPTRPGISVTPEEEALNGAIRIIGVKGFRERVKADLDKIASYPTGKARLDSIENNYKNEPKTRVDISQGHKNTCMHDEASNSGTPSGSTVILDPSSGTEQTPSDVIAYHELTHADNAGQGNSQDNLPSQNDPTAPNREEETTVDSENQYRDDRGVDNRENYADKP